ncbi:HAD family hydrolase [Ramlibacter albus]|uniref:HAD family hydrolase n=1 Tax=Ramlibacter albus TaxID=2079448 RepID=UPI0021069FBF|nr:HAD family phosphatase [Ramlibacter albus]
MNPKYEAVLFDCDGVLVDSESITNGVLRDMLEEIGWKLTAAECMRIFLGKALKDEKAIIEASTGRPLTEEWLASFRARRNEQLELRVGPIPHAVEVVAELHARFEGRIACATGADRGKAELQLRKCGLMQYFEGRLFSGHDLPRSKPAPDVYLAAASALGADPKRCVVVEDTTVGTTAGVAAGATVIGYSPPVPGHDGGALLRAAGAAFVVEDLRQVRELL